MVALLGHPPPPLPVASAASAASACTALNDIIDEVEELWALRQTVSDAARLAAGFTSTSSPTSTTGRSWSGNDFIRFPWWRSTSPLTCGHLDHGQATNGTNSTSGGASEGTIGVFDVSPFTARGLPAAASRAYMVALWHGVHSPNAAPHLLWPPYVVSGWGGGAVDGQ